MTYTAQINKIYHFYNKTKSPSELRLVVSALLVLVGALLVLVRALLTLTSDQKKTLNNKPHLEM